MVLKPFWGGGMSGILLPVNCPEVNRQAHPMEEIADRRSQIVDEEAFAPPSGLFDLRSTILDLFHFLSISEHQPQLSVSPREFQGFAIPAVYDFL